MSEYHRTGDSDRSEKSNNTFAYQGPKFNKILPSLYLLCMENM